MAVKPVLLADIGEGKSIIYTIRLEMHLKAHD